MHLYWSGDRNGVTMQLATIVREATARGSRQHVFFVDGRGPVADELVAAGLATRLGVQSGWNLLGLARLTQAFRRLRPRVVHVHKPALIPTLVAYAACRDAAWVYTEHSPESLTGAPRFRLFYAIFRTRFEAFIALAPELVDVIRGYGVPETRIEEIPCMLAVPLQKQQALREPGIVVGALARLARVKRLDLFVDVVAELRARGCEVTARIVGAGPERQALLDHAATLRVDGLVEFAGETADVAAALDGFDVLLLTSELEVAGTATLEAMARGVPVVAMPSRGGVDASVRAAGILLADRSVSAAADTVARLLASAPERRALQARGLAQAQPHEPAVVLPRLERLYAGLGSHADV